MWIIIESFCQKAGINRHMKHNVLYKLPELQGMGLRNIYYTQGISYVCELVEHIWKKTVTGHLM